MVTAGTVVSYVTLLSVEVEIVLVFPAKSLTLIALTTGTTVPSATIELAVNLNV